MLEKVISGGQTGADRAGLDAAKIVGIPTGGMAPKGWRICLPDGTDGSDPSLADYGLVESDSYDYPPRTRHNAQNSDGTVWFGYLDSPGAKLTLTSAQRAGKPTITNPIAEELVRWLRTHNIKVLNVAGNRASNFNPDIYENTFNTLVIAFKSLSGWDHLIQNSISRLEEAIALEFGKLNLSGWQVLYSDFDRKFAIRFLYLEPTPVGFPAPHPDRLIPSYVTDWFPVRRGQEAVDQAIAQVKTTIDSIPKKFTHFPYGETTGIDKQRINALAGRKLASLQLEGWIVYFGLSEQFFMVKGLFDASGAKFETCAYSSYGSDDQINARLDLIVKEIQDLQQTYQATQSSIG